MNHKSFSTPEIGNISIGIPEFENHTMLRASQRRFLAGLLATLTVWSLPLVLAANSALVMAQVTGRLNDTGLVTCGNDNDNTVPCGYSDGDTSGFARQDAQMGRAAKELAGALTITGSDANSKGFDFTKLRYDTGAVLASGTALGIGANWGCTKDNVTGLIWLVKSPSGNDFRLASNTYKWYDNISTRNGGNAGNNSTDTSTCYNTNCDTKALIDYTNALSTTVGICGEGTKQDWRLPTRLELMTIVDLSKQGTGTATADSFYFPNMRSGNYWTQDNVAGNPTVARTVNFGNGGDGATASKSSKNYVILVRPSP